MSIKNLRYSFILLALFVFAGTAAAQGPVVGNGPTTSELAMTAEVVTAVQLNISGALVTGSDATGLFAIDFGDVNALGTGTPTVGVSVSSVDGTGATYTAPISLMPVFTGFTTETADVTVEAGTAGDEAMSLEGANVGAAVTVTTTPAPAVVAGASEAGVARVVGFRVLRSMAAGPVAATLIYTIDVN
jgi:hypothetical protein